MTPIKKLPALDWNDLAKREIFLTGADLVEQSDFAYQIGTVAIAGLIYSSYTAPPWFWFALAKGITIRDLIDFRALREQIPVGALTGIKEDRLEAQRFARFYGFEDTGEVRLGYMIFRRT